MTDNHTTETDALWERIRDDLPESFWKVATWVPSGNYVTGALDVADRKRIALAILGAATPTANEIVCDECGHGIGSHGYVGGCTGEFDCPCRRTPDHLSKPTGEQ